MIGIIDSGIGGKGIEKEIRKLLPNVRIKYLADTKNFPYGTKKIVVLHNILENNIKELSKKGARIIVLACNSATVSSVKYLRRKFDVPIVGVVPAIKPAAEATKTKNIAIFATPITSRSLAQDDLINKYCKDIVVYKIPFKNLAGLIERGKTDAITYEVIAVWRKYKDKNIDTIVLGCTHYTLIRKEIQKIVGKNVKIIDSNIAVAKQVKKIYDRLEEKNGR
ncbi:MAG: glutamate racemase [Patescibacteria group bacterium]|nr:glutamate racemase [Patescibacteria group bacterium]